MRLTHWLSSSLIFAASSWNPLLSSKVLYNNLGICSLMMASAASTIDNVDDMYPGTAVPRMMAIRERVKSLNFESSQPWRVATQDDSKGWRFEGFAIGSSR